MPYNDRLFSLLQELDDQELRAVWEDALKCSPEHEDFAIGSREVRVLNISREWRAIHGHTLLNMRRGSHDLPWKRILIDVADKLKPGWGWSEFSMDGPQTEQEIEAAILRFFDDRAKETWADMSTEDRTRLADSIEQQLSATCTAVSKVAGASGARSVTASSLGAGISAGLLSGAGATVLAQGTASFAVGGVVGGALYQLGFWLVVRLFGAWSGVQLAAGGGAAAVGGAFLSAPAAIAFAANAVMSTSYRKSIPATLLVLTAHELRRQLSALEVKK